MFSIRKKYVLCFTNIVQGEPQINQPYFIVYIYIMYVGILNLEKIIQFSLQQTIIERNSRLNSRIDTCVTCFFRWLGRFCQVQSMGDTVGDTDSNKETGNGNFQLE